MVGSNGFCKGVDVDLHYRRTGGSKPPLVLLHGLSASGACWSPLARALEDRFDVVMPDARGHGLSSAPLHGYRYEDHARDVVALIDDLGLVAPILLGHSMGGMTAAVVASRDTTVLSGVVLVDPTFISPEWQRDVRDSDVAERHRGLLDLDRAVVLADLRARHPHRTSEIVELLADARMQMRLSAFDVLTPPNPQYRQLVREIRVPTLLVIADSGVVSFDTAVELQGLNRRIQIERIHDAGHGVPFDQPERFAAVVRAFAAVVAFAER
ncbi:MAG TPA: alpha/beta hydrolase [Candidatus Acidoferrales bacterium]|jgi:N-formylmaleamate deformylase|nr:alpha/beta hydrolase [Candidatus Acidoferrales bacterium]